jgi:penicillin-binding protein 1A
MAARVFADFMREALKNESNQPFSVPDGLSFVRVNRNSGVAASQDPNGVIITEVFKPGQGPNKPQKIKEESKKTAVGGIF